MNDDETRFDSDEQLHDQPLIVFRVHRRQHNRGKETHYPVRFGFRSEDQILRQLAREHPDIDWARYQFIYDKLMEETKWKPSKVHRWLGSRKELWRKPTLNEKQMDEAEQAFAGLPNEGPADKDINWVKTHPRIFRLRQADKDEDAGTVTALSVDDILHASNGPAPSKSAVTMLQEALENLNKFWAAILSEQKKTTAKAESSKPPEDAWGDDSDDGELDDLDDDDDEAI